MVYSQKKDNKSHLWLIEDAHLLDEVSANFLAIVAGNNTDHGMLAPNQ
jgi:hypothetical protein